MKVIVSFLALCAAVVSAQSYFEQGAEDTSFESPQDEQVDSFLSTDFWLGGVLHPSDRESMSNESMDNANHGSRKLQGANCNPLQVSIRKSAIATAAIVLENGYSFEIPFYVKSSQRRLGTWYETLTYANTRQTMGSGLVTLQFDEKSSLALSAVAGQRQLAILGGSGTLGSCPAGYGTVVADGPDIVVFEFQICDVCA
jgi:hypothetical protein